MAVDQLVAFVGAGNMAEALLRGLLGTGTVSPRRCIVTNKSNDARLRGFAAQWGIGTTRDKAHLMREGDVVILAVKPRDMPVVLDEIAPHATPRHLVVSVAAGVPLATIEHRLRGVPVIRTMPNTSTAVNASATALCAGRWAAASHLDVARRMFGAVGRVVAVPEPLFDAVTGLSGSGPAYVYLLAEAMVDAGIRAGLDHETALHLVSQTVLGAGKMLAESGHDPAALRARVTSPNGTTMAGVRALEEGGFPAAVRDAVARATARARELRDAPARPADTQPL
ncbi:MAG TPA: pyrroline-5-carboxylate reductase [bacterium]|nr:pyrroline-5-carboxylate reductase [bacterium]